MKYLHLVATAATGLLLMLGSLDMPDTGDPASPPSLHVSPRYIEQGFEETAVPNMVTAVLADYRSFDTFGRGHGRLHRGGGRLSHPPNRTGGRVVITAQQSNKRQDPLSSAGAVALLS